MRVLSFTFRGEKNPFVVGEPDYPVADVTVKPYRPSVNGEHSGLSCAECGPEVVAESMFAFQVGIAARQKVQVVEGWENGSCAIWNPSACILLPVCDTMPCR